MAFPHDQDGAGDIKSLRRAAWHGAGGSSPYMAWNGGSALGGAGYGSVEYNWDQPEGWATRITNHGATEVPPFDHGTSGASSTCKFVYQSGLTNLPRTNSAGGITTGTTGYVIELTNYRNANQSIYTLPYGSGEGSIAATLHDTNRSPHNGHWYLSWYGKKATGIANAGTVRQAIYAFGTIYTGVIVNDGYEGHTDGGNAGNSSLANPKHSGTFYRSNGETLTTDWQKYDMCFKFSGSAGLPTNINLRLDSWDGAAGSAHTTCYFDRITLHPLNISLSSSRADVSGPPYKMSDATYGTYHE